MNDDASRSRAPGLLEDVRAFLNSWSISNATRREVDTLQDWTSRTSLWNSRLPNIPAPRETETQELVALRQAMREFLGGYPGAFNELLASEKRIDMQTFQDGVKFHGDDTAQGTLEAILMNAVVSKLAVRLRACDDCGWVFFDSSRNNRRRWCAMEPSPGVRGCGAAAKAKRYRHRQDHNQPPRPSD